MYLQVNIFRAQNISFCKINPIQKRWTQINKSLFKKTIITYTTIFIHGCQSTQVTFNESERQFTPTHLI